MAIYPLTTPQMTQGKDLKLLEGHHENLKTMNFSLKTKSWIMAMILLIKSYVSVTRNKVFESYTWFMSYDSDEWYDDSINCIRNWTLQRNSLRE